MSKPHALTSRQQDLVLAAVRLVDKVGIDGFTMRALAEEIGLSPMAAYKHFANQKLLQLEVWRECMSKFGLQLATAAERATGTEIDQFLSMVEDFLSFGQAHPRRFEFMFLDNFVVEAWDEPSLDALNAKVWGQTYILVQRGQENGNIRTDVVTQELFANIYSCALGAGYLMLSNRLERRMNLNAAAVKRSALERIREMMEPR